MDNGDMLQLVVKSNNAHDKLKVLLLPRACM